MPSAKGFYAYEQSIQYVTVVLFTTSEARDKWIHGQRNRFVVTVTDLRHSIVYWKQCLYKVTYIGCYPNSRSPTTNETRYEAAKRRAQESGIAGVSLDPIAI